MTQSETTLCRSVSQDDLHPMSHRLVYITLTCYCGTYQSANAHIFAWSLTQVVDQKLSLLQFFDNLVNDRYRFTLLLVLVCVIRVGPII
jgi:hypothetical protein